MPFRNEGYFFGSVVGVEYFQPLQEVCEVFEVWFKRLAPSIPQGGSWKRFPIVLFVS
jgi:hypothetical protein